ncbi:MAG: lysophospholipid acyltransferase family protein [Spirochaetota bacterium]
MLRMDAQFPPEASVEAHSEEMLHNLLSLREFFPPMDLSEGQYHSKDIPQKFRNPGNIIAGLSLFRDYMKIVRRDRALALRGEYSDYLWGRSGLELTRLYETYGGRFHIQGLEHLRPWLNEPAKAPVVFIANHMSTLETLTLCGYITPYMRTTFVVKSALVRGYFAPLICSRPYVALERKDPLADLSIVLNEGRAILQGKGNRSRSLIIFPQGTREVHLFTRSRLNSIGVRLAAEAGVELVPIALSTSFWSRSQHKAIQYIPLLHPEREVRFAFGAPLKVTGRRKEAQRQILDFISEHMRSWNIPVQD